MGWFYISFHSSVDPSFWTLSKVLGGQVYFLFHALDHVVNGSSVVSQGKRYRSDCEVRRIGLFGGWNTNSGLSQRLWSDSRQFGWVCEPSHAHPLLILVQNRARMWIKLSASRCELRRSFYPRSTWFNLAVFLLIDKDTIFRIQVGHWRMVLLLSLIHSNLVPPIDIGWWWILSQSPMPQIILRVLVDSLRTNSLFIVFMLLLYSFFTLVEQKVWTLGIEISEGLLLGCLPLSMQFRLLFQWTPFLRHFNLTAGGVTKSSFELEKGTRWIIQERLASIYRILIHSYCGSREVQLLLGWGLASLLCSIIYRGRALVQLPDWSLVPDIIELFLLQIFVAFLGWDGGYFANFLFLLSQFAIWQVVVRHLLRWRTIPHFYFDHVVL